MTTAVSEPGPGATSAEVAGMVSGVMAESRPPLLDAALSGRREQENLRHSDNFLSAHDLRMHQRYRELFTQALGSFVYGSEEEWGSRPTQATTIRSARVRAGLPDLEKALALDDDKVLGLLQEADLFAAAAYSTEGTGGRPYDKVRLGSLFDPCLVNFRIEDAIDRDVENPVADNRFDTTPVSHGCCDPSCTDDLRGCPKARTRRGEAASPRLGDSVGGASTRRQSKCGRRRSCLQTDFW